VREGDLISITVEDLDGHLYRIALDRFVRERQEQLRAAETDLEAEQELNTLSHLTRKRPREIAQKELLRIAERSAHEPRPSVILGVTERHEQVPSGIRILLRELHEAKCQLCSFTIRKTKRRTVL
jgi:hypothetical protein